MPPLSILLSLAVLCTPVSNFCLQSDPESGVLCGDAQMLSTLTEDDYDPQDLNNAPYHRTVEEPEDTRERRTSPASSYKFLSHTLLRSKLYGNSARSERRSSRVTLSLDVPTNLMNVLFNIARAKSLRAKAAHNARLMAQIGRR